MARIVPTPAVPMGFKFDPDASIIENAQGAWNRKREITGQQGEHGARVLARRIFHNDDFIFDYLPLYPTMPTFEIDGELIGYEHGQFMLLELCHDCGKAARQIEFKDLAGFGAALEISDQKQDYVCQECQFKARLKELKAA